MHANGSPTNGIRLNSVRRQADLVFERINRHAGHLAKDTKVSSVHRFRTNSRRVEALVSELAPESPNTKKLLKLLSKLRKRAGKLRDLDVQIAFLKEQRIPDRQNHCVQLLAALEEEQARRSKKLAKHFDKKKVSQLRKRLRRAKSELAIDGVDPVKLAFGLLPKFHQAPQTEKMLHSCRIAAKGARYVAELAPESAVAKSLIVELKRAQDEIGRWHDVLKLSQRAERRFGGLRDSSLVAALQNIGRARFRRAGNAWETALKAVAELHPSAVPEASGRRATEQTAPARQSAAA